MSLVTTPARELTTCTHCASNRVMHIAMTLTDGSLVDFASCLRCERKTWSQGGSGLSVTDVLSKAAKPGSHAAVGAGSRLGQRAK